MLELDTRFLNRYQIKYIIEQQPEYMLYSAADQQDEQPVIIAELLHKDQAALNATQRLAHEVALIHTPGFLRLRHHFAHHLTCYVIVDDPGGQDIERAVRDEAVFTALQRISEQTRVPYQVTRLLDVFEALHVHQPPLLVGDLHSTDLWVSPAGELMLAPFALLRPIGVGLSPYRAPELEQHTSEPTIPGDLYVVGAVCYHLLSGGPPPAAARRLTGIPLNPLPLLDQQVAPLLDQIVRRALELDPADRYQTVREMRLALELISLLEKPAPPTTAEVLPELVRKQSDTNQQDTNQPPAPQPTADSNTCLITALIALLVLAVGLSSVAIFFLLGPGSRMLSG